MESTNASAVGATAPPLEAFESDGNSKKVEGGAAKLDQLPALTRPGLGALGMHEPYVRSLVRRTPDWPREGVNFLDMSPLLADSRALKLCVDCLAERYRGAGITHVAGIDARGFTIGCALAYALSCGFIMVRKDGKLPSGSDGSNLLSEEYAMEYGSGRLQVSADTFDTSRATIPRIVLVDDLLATGGTAAAACNLLILAGATIVEVAVLMEITDLNGRRRLKDEAYIDVHSLLAFTEE